MAVAFVMVRSHHTASSRPARSRHRSASIAGYNLMEVMFTIFLIGLMSLSAIAAIQQTARAAMSVAVRDEAYHLLQDKAEQLLAGNYNNFVAAADETLYSSVKTTFLPGTQAALTLPAAADNDNLQARIAYTRSVTLVSSTPGRNATLQVQVAWKWQGRPYQISTQLFRTP